MMTHRRKSASQVRYFEQSVPFRCRVGAAMACVIVAATFACGVNAQGYAPQNAPQQPPQGYPPPQPGHPPHGPPGPQSGYPPQQQGGYGQAQPGYGGQASPGPQNLDQLMAWERQDMGVAATKTLHTGAMHGPTPNTIPG